MSISDKKPSQLPPLANTVWSKMDKKAAAITEFTMRQYRQRTSTWTIGLIGTLMVIMMLMFYLDGLSSEIEAIDQDGDSLDWDGDGYPNGQEKQYGTNLNNPDSHPPSSVEPDSPEKWTDEDKIDGVDNDGDCALETLSSFKDSNRDGIECNAPHTSSFSADNKVDEDPDDEAYFQEATHRSFILGFGKMGFVFILGIFIPLFMATGIIRDEMESETLHYLVGKPLARAEFLVYRILGLLGLAWPYIIALTLLCAIVTGFAGPGDQIFRFNELGLWFSIMVASCLAILAYSTIFAVFGIISRYGMIAALFLGVWEFMIAMMYSFGSTSAVTMLSVVFWTSQIVDAASVYTWSDYSTMVIHVQNTSMELAGSSALEALWKAPVISTEFQLMPVISATISALVLILLSTSLLFIGQGIFKRKELK